MAEVMVDAEAAAAVRGLIPTQRELDGGVVSPNAFLPRSDEREYQPPRGQLLRASLSQMRLRNITGGAAAPSLILISWFFMIQSMDSQAFNLLLPEIRNDFGANVALLTALPVIITLAESGLAPFFGYLADRTRRITMLGVGAVVAHASIVLSGLAPTVGALAGSRLLGGVGDVARAPVGFSLATDSFPVRNRPQVFAFFGMAGVIGGVLGPIVVGLVATNMGWRPTLVVLGSIAAVVSLLIFRLKEPVRGMQDRLAAGADVETAMREQRAIGWSEAWRAAWSVRTLRFIAYATPFTAASTGSLAVLSVLVYAQQFHLDPFGRGLVVALTTLPSLVGLAIGARVSQRLLVRRPGRILTLIAGIEVLNALGWLIFVNMPILPLAVLTNIIPAFFTAVITPTTTTALSLVIPARIRGLGLQTVAPWALFGIPVPIMLAIYASTSGVGGAIVILLPIILIGAAFHAAAAGGFAQDMRAASAASLAEAAVREARESGRSKLLICRGVDVTYSGSTVLHDVDLDVEEGELVALLGTNGAGKSTLLRAISGVEHLSNGAIFLDGDDITHLPPHLIAARGVVMMPGGEAVFPTLTVEENLAAAAWLQRNDHDHVRTRTEEIFDRFPQLRERLGTRAGDLSGGEQHMLALGQALLMKPRLLMIDELSLGLAPPVVATLLDALREISRQGTTVIIVEQSINVALQVAQRAIFMERGELRFDGPAQELVSRPDMIRSIFLATAVTSGGLNRAREPGGEAGAPQRSGAVLDVSDVRLSYGGVQVLTGTSMRVWRSEVLGLVGPNGAGKTTLLDVVSGFARPDSGRVTLLGTDVTRRLPDHRARLGLGRSYQNVRLFPALSVRENIGVALERHLKSRSAVLAALWSPATRRSERSVRRRVDNLVDSLGLGDYADKFVGELSTGTRRVVDIACVLAAEPQLLLLDEPSSGLARAETELLGPLIGRIVKETGCSILIIEHDLGLVAAVSDRLIAMRLGAVMAEGSPEKVLAEDDVIDTILGGSSAAVTDRSTQTLAAQTT